MADRKRINVFAHAADVPTLCQGLLQWAQDSPLYGVFRSIFLVAADIDNRALEPTRRGECLSDAARNVVVYYANDDWQLPTRGPVRCIGHTGPADMSKVAKNVYAVDCDDFNNLIHFPDGHKYYLDWNAEEVPSRTPSPVWIHMLHAMKTGRVEADPSTRIRRLKTSGPRRQSGGSTEVV